MSIDPDELKVRRRKAEDQIQDIQKYMEELDGLDEQKKTGKLGPHEVKREGSPTEIPQHLVKGILNLNRE